MPDPEPLSFDPPPLFWPIMLGLTALLAALLLAGPLTAMFSAGSTDFNEGWNAYFEQDAATGVPLYPPPGGLVNCYYPPLGFHLIGLAGRITGDINQTGRWVALVSLALIALFCGAIVRLFTGSLPLAAYTALAVVVWIAVYKSDRIGMNDPQLFGSVFSLLGLYLYLRFPASFRWLCVSAATFTVSVFIKHSLLAFPAAAALHLLLERRWKALAVWSGVVAVGSALMMLLAISVDGPYFIASLLVGRTQVGWLTRVTDYAVAFQIPLALAIIWSVRHAAQSSDRVLILALSTAHFFAFAFAGGDGVERNTFFDCLYILIIIGSLVFGDYAPHVASWKRGGLVLAALLIAASSGILLQSPLRLRYERQEMKSIPQRASDFESAVRAIRAQGGLALCEEPLVCFEAGKPFRFDPFTVSSGIKTGRLKEPEIIALIQSAQFRSIQLKGADLDHPEFATLPPNVMKVVLARYRVEARMPTSLVLVPND